MSHSTINPTAGRSDTGSQRNPAGRRYVIVSPCRNEADHLPATIRTIAAQTVLPTKWIIVDDGSTDATPDIIRAAMAEHPWIEHVRREDRGRRSVGPGVIEAVYSGLERVNLDDYDYLCKLDSDLELPPTYFQTIIQMMEADPLLGNYSGKVYLRDPDGTLVPERMGDENAIGAAKFYRVACFRDIGGFVRQVSWDGIDGHMCRMKGWIAGSADTEPLRIIHRRLMGSSERSIWEGRKRWGRGKWYMGSAWYYVCAVAAYRMAERPLIVGGVGILWGYLRAMLSGMERHGDAAWRRHLRRYEWRSLIRGKRRTLDETNAAIRAAATNGGRRWAS